MKKYNLLFLNLFLSCTMAQVVEYYPSQNFLDSSNIINVENQRENKKHYTKTKWLIQDQQNKDIKTWRNFNSNNLFEHDVNIAKRSVDPVFHGNPKTREELWNERFLNKSTAFDQTPSLIKLIHNITMTYLNDCIPLILYDNVLRSRETFLFQNLLKDYPVTYVQGYIKDNNKLVEPKLLIPTKECLHFILFLSDITTSAKVLGKQSVNKVVIVARSSQWAVQEFLAGPLSRKFVNLLVIGQSFKDDDDELLEAPYILYTHKLYTDGLGASKPVVLNSWSHGKFSRNVNLFPRKLSSGYAGHRFLVAVANQPPYVIKRIKSDVDGSNPRVVYDGTEIRLLRLLAERNNFSIEFVEPKELQLGSGDAVTKEITAGRADIAVSGMYVTVERLHAMDLSFSHSQDCAAFITIASVALPRYRAILGPFHWHVWVALTFTYLIGIFPLAFSDKHSLRHLMHNAGEVENMFWYVFGTFTNCFTFVGKNSWSRTTKVTTRLLIGWYWIFTIIITSCYTGSIIAFVTLPVFPETIDSIKQVLNGFFRIGTLDRGGWEQWFLNSSDTNTAKLIKKMEFVPSVESGIRNITKAFFWSYAFLGSRAELEYIVQANFSKTKSKRSLMHISDECFVPFGVSIAFPKNSVHSTKLSMDISRMVQSGIVGKIVDEVRWEMQRSSSGRFLSAKNIALKTTAIEEKGLAFEDTQGMFLLLAAGFLLGAIALLSEWMGGCSRKCIPRKKDDVPKSLNSQEPIITTPKLYSRIEIKLISDENESNGDFDNRISSASSRETLDGEIINVTEENIIVHEQYSTDNWDSRRPSSVDVDKEVRDIFEKDMKRKRMFSDGVIELSEEMRQATASKGAFGNHLARS